MVNWTEAQERDDAVILSFVVSRAVSVRVAFAAAAYDLSGTDSSWMCALTQAAASAIDRGLGVVGYCYDMSTPTPSGWAFTSSLASRGMVEAAERIVCNDEPRELRAFYRGIEGAGVFSRTSVMGREDEQLSPARGMEVRDVLALNAALGSGHGCQLSAPSPEMIERKPLVNARWNEMATHLHTGYRLRRCISASPPARLGTDSAIVGADGRTHSAFGRARDRDSRALLRELARTTVASMSSRPNRTHVASDVWEAILDGRWSSVDRFEHAGRLYFVARRAPTGHADPRALTPGELAVARWTAGGRSIKWIALELGLPRTTVSTCLDRIQDKLGASGRTELRRVLAAMADVFEGP